MPEKFPQFPQPPEEPNQPESHPEREPVSYKRVLEAAKALNAAGVDPLVGEEQRSNRLQEAWDLKDRWEAENQLGMRGIGTPEKAANIVRAANIWIDAGYSQSKVLRDAMEHLADEHADALRESNEETIKILREAMEAVENKLAAKNPKEKASAKLQAYLDEAQRYAAAGKNMEAVQTLTSALFHPELKRVLTEEKKKEIRDLREEIKKKGI
jgi:hypothetical protein